MKQNINDSILRNNDTFDFEKLRKEIAAIIAINRIEVDVSSEEIADVILHAIFNKKN